jgi:hypothetical protein
VPASASAKRYRGIDREPLQAFSDEHVRLLGDTVPPRAEHAAQRLLASLEDRGLFYWDFIFALSDAVEAFGLLDHADEYELIFASAHEAADAPGEWVRLGYEPTWFGGDHFSALADCMFFPRWHGPGSDRTTFQRYFDDLNRDGLFEDVNGAQAFLDYYLSFRWTETGSYVIAEIWAPASEEN